MMETSLADMKTGFPQAPEPIQGIPNLQSMIKLLFHLCPCVQTQRSQAFATVNLLFCAAPSEVYAFLTAEVYPAAFAPFPPVLPDVPSYTACMYDNKHAAAKAMHAIDKKTWVDIITMNTALANIFLEALSLQVRASFLQRRLRELNIVFIHMFVWFVNHYGKLWQRIVKQKVSKWRLTGILPTGIPLAVLTHSSSASLPARCLQDAPTSQWLTRTLSTLAFA
jgi:hypothetical protein